MRAIDADAMIDRLKEWDTKDKTDKALYNFTLNRINEQPTIQPAEPKRETATVSAGISKGGVTMWYECAACGEPVDQGDTFCSGCGRRLIHE